MLVTPKVYEDLNLIEWACYIEIELRRFERENCYSTFLELLSFVNLHSRFTKRFEQEIYECCQEKAAIYASKKFGINNKNARKTYQELTRQKEKLSPFFPTKAIGIDLG
jgi:transposase